MDDTTNPAAGDWKRLRDPRLVPRVERGELPERYAEAWFEPLFQAASPALTRGAKILDVGGGRNPLLPEGLRPESSTYVGLDISPGELNLAGPDAYDQTFVGDIGGYVPDLAGRFDLILSWQVLEHVDSTERALQNMRAYLRPGGRMVAQLSGRFGVYALLARVIPHRVSQQLMAKLLSSDPEQKFPTRYDSCDAASLSRLLSDWTTVNILPRYRAAVYFSFWRPLERFYLVYEDWAIRSGRANLATHYLVTAVN